MDDLVGLLLVAVLFGALFSMLLCIACDHRKRPSFWLAPLSALATGIAMFLYAFGSMPSMSRFFTSSQVIAEPGTALELGLEIFISQCSIFAVIGLFPSLGVIAIYRFLRKRRLSEEQPPISTGAGPQ